MTISKLAGWSSIIILISIVIVIFLIEEFSLTDAKGFRLRLRPPADQFAVLRLLNLDILGSRKLICVYDDYYLLGVEKLERRGGVVKRPLGLTVLVI